MNTEEILLTCECNCSEHQLIIKYFDDEYPYVYVDMYLAPQSFWKRIKYAVKYVLGKQSKFGAFDEIILSDKHIKPLEKVVEHLKKAEASLLQTKLFNDGHSIGN